MNVLEYLIEMVKKQKIKYNLTKTVSINLPAIGSEFTDAY